MKQSFKKMYMFVLALCMCVGLMGGTALADEPGANDENVCAIGETGYSTLSAAVAAANESEGDDVITMLKDIDFDSAETLSITGKITITGDYTISRGSYAGTMFAVPSGSILILKDITVDGENDWVLDKETYDADVKSGTRFYYETGHYITLEAGALVANGAVVNVSGEVFLDGVTIKNSASSTSLFWVNNGSKLTMDDTIIEHNTRSGSSVVADVGSTGNWIINDGTIIRNNHNQNGNGTLSYMCGTTVMNGGKIYGNTGENTNGSVMMLYGGNANFTMNGGEIYENSATYGWSNGWNSAFYVYGNGSRFTMNDGVIKDHFSSSIPGVASNGSDALITVNGGEIVNTVSGRGFTAKDIYSYCPVHVSKEVDSATNGFFNNVLNIGTLNGDSWFYKNEMTYSGRGTFNGDVTVTSGAETTMVDGQWINGIVWVKAVGTDSTLTVKPGATINGIQVRVLDSVASGDYLNAAEATAAQAASYVEEDGANVISPVLYYHRLTSDQQKNIVVTFDYNGGLDAQGWSGCQMTSDAAFAPESPQPTKAGYSFAGWKYAVEGNHDPESLSMASDVDYQGEAISATLRLIAQWENPSGEEDGDEDEGVVGPDRTLTFVKNAKVEENGKEVLYPLMGIKFDIYYLCSVEEYNQALVAGTITEKTKVSELPFIRTFVATAITDAAGHAMYNLTENGQPDGIYVIEEQEHDAIVAPVEAFLVAVPMTDNREGHEGEPKYDIVLQMKNEVVRPVVDKDVTAIGQKEDTADVGEIVTWIIRGDVPKDMANAISYKLTDVIDYRLTFMDNVVVKVEDTTGLATALTLDPATDYKVTETEGTVKVNGVDEEITTIQVELLEAGRAKVAEKAGKSYENFEVRVYFDTYIDEDAVLGVEIPNTVTLEYTNSANFDWSVVPKEDPEVYTTGIHVHKFDAKDVNKDLEGAVFKLARIATDAEINDGKSVTLVIKDQNGVSSINVVYVDFYDSAVMSGDKVNTITTDKNGNAMIYGLEAGTYYLVETKAPAGYNLLSYPVQVSLDKTSHHTGDIEATQEIEEIDRTVYVANSNTFVLPETGGIGTAVFTLAGSLMMGGAGVMLVNKKRDEE